MDIIGSLPSTRALTKYVIMAIDYFTKWVETKPLAVIIDAKMSNFIWRNIIYRFKILYAIVINNGK